MKYLLMALTIVIGLEFNVLQAASPYQGMADTEATLKDHKGKRRVFAAIQLLDLAKLGHANDSPTEKGKPNIAEERANVNEKQINIRAIATAAFVIIRSLEKTLEHGGISVWAADFFNESLTRAGLQNHEHDHIYMVATVFDVAAQYFHLGAPHRCAAAATPAVPDTVNVLLKRRDITHFRTKDLITSHDDLVLYLNDFSDSSATKAPASLAVLFDDVEQTHRSLFDAPAASVPTSSAAIVVTVTAPPPVPAPAKSRTPRTPAKAKALVPSPSAAGHRPPPPGAAALLPHRSPTLSASPDSGALHGFASSPGVLSASFMSVMELPMASTAASVLAGASPPPPAPEHHHVPVLTSTATATSTDTAVAAAVVHHGTASVGSTSTAVVAPPSTGSAPPPPPPAAAEEGKGKNDGSDCIIA